MAEDADKPGKGGLYASVVATWLLFFSRGRVSVALISTSPQYPADNALPAMMCADRLACCLSQASPQTFVATEANQEICQGSRAASPIEQPISVVLNNALYLPDAAGHHRLSRSHVLE